MLETNENTVSIGKHFKQALTFIKLQIGQYNDELYSISMDRHIKKITVLRHYLETN